MNNAKRNGMNQFPCPQIRFIHYILLKKRRPKL
jgi:hypothetical protein